MWLYAVGLAAIGATTGLFVGLSKSAVVAVALPLVLGLIGGTGGYAWPGEKPKLWQLGLALTCIAAATCFGTLYGALLRTGSSWADLVPASADTASFDADISGLNSDDAVAALLLDQQLRQMGVPGATRQKIIDRRKAEAACPQRAGFITASRDLFEAWDKSIAAQAPAAAVVRPSLADQLEGFRVVAATAIYKGCDDAELSKSLAQTAMNAAAMRLDDSWKDWSKQHPELDARIAAWLDSIDALIKRQTRAGYADLLGMLKADAKDLTIDLPQNKINVERARDAFRPKE
jgi:hypothetical protein